MRKIIKILAVFLISTIGLIFLVFFLINLPFSDRIVSRQVNSLFNKLELPLHIQSVRTVLPYKLQLEGVTISGPGGDTIICVMEMDAQITLPALLNNKIKLKELYMGGVMVHLSNDSTNTGLNIARAFSKNKNANPEKPKEKEVSWEIDIRRGALQNISFLMLDPSIGIQIEEEIEDLKLTGFNLSLLNRSLLFKGIDLETAHGGIKISPRLIPPKTEESVPWTFGLRKVQLSTLDFTFNQVTDSLLLKLVLQEGRFRTRVSDFSNNKIDADIIKLSGADATILTGMTEKPSESSEKQASQAFPWDIIIDDTNLQNVKLSRGPYLSPDTTATTSPPDINLHDMHLVDTRLNNRTAEVLVKKLGFDLANGFSLQKMNGTFSSNQKSTHVDFKIETENSRAELQLAAEESVFDMLENPDSIRNAHLSFQNTLLSLQDLFCFKEDLKNLPTLKSLSSAPLAIEGALGLDHSLMALSDVRLSRENNFTLALDGSARHPFQIKKAKGNLDLEFSAMDSVWLRDMMKELDFEGNHSALRSLSLNVLLSDSLGSLDVNLGLISNLGELDLYGSIDLNNEGFNLKTTFRDLLPGQFMEVEPLGAISGSGSLSGKGFHPDSLSANASFLIDSITFGDYQYTNASITAEILPASYKINLLVDDPGLRTELYSTINQSDSSFNLNASATLFAQLDRIKLVQDTISVESTIRADFSKSPHAISAGMNFQNIEILNPYGEANIQELSAVLSTDSSETGLKAESDFFTTDIEIGKPVDQVGTFLQHFQSYFRTFVDSTGVEADTRISKLPTTNISGRIAYHDALGMVLQDTGIYFDSIDFSLINSLSDQSLNYEIKGNNLVYGNIKIGELDVSAIDTAGVMDFQLKADKNTFFGNPAHDILLRGKYDNWSSDAEFSVIDDSAKIIYNIELASELDSNLFALNIPKQEIILNAQKWEVENPVLLYYNLIDKKLYPRLNMKIDDAFIRIYSTDLEGAHQYACQFENVFFESLFRSSLIPGQPRGILSGQLNYGLSEEAERNINSDLQFNNIKWYNLDFDLITLKGFIISDTAGAFELDMTTRIDTSQIEVEFEQTPDDSRSLSTNFNSLPIAVFQPFVRKELSEMSGNVSGNFDISSEGDGGIDGTLIFNNASTRINALNSKFRLPDERVKFSENRLVFNAFHVLDTLNNTLDINGFIEIDNEWKIYTNLDIGSSGLQVMNTSGEDQETFYGDIYLDSRISIVGPVNNPVIKGNLLLARGSEVNYRYTEDLSLSESAKYVTFVSATEDDKPGTHFNTKHSKIFQSSIETNLEIDPATRINFSLSKWAFDIDLGISGEGALNFQMLNNNQYSLSGRYQINEGDANLKLIGWPNKAFRIADGGFIRWDGQIDNPELKFEAANRVASSYTNPVDGKMRTVDIDVFLKLSNQLSDLDIEFTIFTSDQYLMSIINTLSPEEQTRQAITILLFETIDLPGISSSTSYMTQQVNQLMAAQLNSLTKTTISGIDISFGVNTYVEATEGGGEETKTSLSYDVRKKFADDRAQMRVSGRMNDLYNEPGASNFSLNNISLEYQLDSAASRYLKVYNERSYEDVFEGEVVKTGVGITFRKRYWNIREIWKRKQKKK